MSIKNGNQIKSGAVISYFAIAISIIAALLYTPWMKDQIGDANYGIYTLSSSLISIFLMDFGLGTSVTRFIAKYRAEENSQSIADVLGYVGKLYLVIDAVILIVLVIVYSCIERIFVGLTIQEIGTLRSVFLVFGTYSVLAFPFTPLSGILNAYELFVEMKLCDLFQKLLAIVLIIIILLCGHGVIALVVMNAIAGLICVVVKLWFILKKIQVRPNFSVHNREMLKEILGFSIWVTVLAFAQRMIFNLAPSILGITSNSMEIARFAPASQMEGYFYTFAFAINGLFLPTVARYDQKADQSAILRLAEKVGRYQMCVLGLLFTGIAVVGAEFMRLWMGAEYEICGFCTTLMIMPSLFQYPQQILNTMLSVRNLVKYQAMAAMAMGVANVIISFVLTPSLGVVGSSVSIAIAYILNLILLNIVYWRKMGLNLRRFYIQVFAKYLWIIVVSIALAKLILSSVSWSGWTGFFCSVIVTGGVYVVLLFSGGFTREERSSIITKLKKK